MSSENKEADGTENLRKLPAKKTVVFSLNVPPNSKNQDGSVSKPSQPNLQGRRSLASLAWRFLMKFTIHIPFQSKAAQPSQSRDGNSSGSLLVRCFPVVFLGMFFLGLYTGSAMVKYLHSMLRSIFFQDRSYYTGRVENV